MNGFTMKKVDQNLTRSMLDIVVLGLLKNKSMHGYGIIQSIRKNFGVYFGPSTVYPYLKELEKKGQIKSEWNLSHERPRKVYTLAPKGNDFLVSTEQSLRTICHKLASMGINAPSQTINKPERILTPKI